MIPLVATPSPVASPLALPISLAGSPWWQRLAQAVARTRARMRHARRERHCRELAARLDPHLVKDLGLTPWAPAQPPSAWSELDRMRW